MGRVDFVLSMGVKRQLCAKKKKRKHFKIKKHPKIEWAWTIEWDSMAISEDKVSFIYRGKVLMHMSLGGADFKCGETATVQFAKEEKGNLKFTILTDFN